MSWQLHLVPGVPVENWRPMVDLRVFDNDNILLDSYDGSWRWASQNGGKTWQQVPIRPRGTIEEIPSGANARVQPDSGVAVGIVVTLPNGESFNLASPPAAPIISTQLDMKTGTDGSFWLEGSADSRLWILFSRDRGRTWHDLVPPPGYSPTDGISLVDGLLTYDGRTVYWSGSRKVWRTTDDGAHWAALDVSAVPMRQDENELVPAIRRDNGMQFEDLVTGKTFVVSATDMAFVPGSAKDLSMVATTFGGARHIRYKDGEVVHSADGVNWVELKLP